MRFAFLPLLILPLVPPVAGRAAEIPGTWHKSCETPKEAARRCFVEQIAVARPGGGAVLRVGLEAQPDGRARLTALAPLGISLRVGLDLAVDGAAPVTLPFERCTGRGCEVSAILDWTALETFVKGTTLTVRYAPTEASSASVPLRLEGLAAALDSLSR